MLLHSNDDVSFQCYSEMVKVSDTKLPIIAQQNYGLNDKKYDYSIKTHIFVAIHAKVIEGELVDL